MSSMLSKNQIKYRDIQGYLFSYDRNTVETAEVWAKEHSTGFEPGMMVFCLEKVAPQSAMVVGRKDDGDSYKVSDLCFVVGEDDNRALGVNITSNVYDLRFIEVLLCEKAQKAILNEKDFLYVTCRPAITLNEAKIHEIEQVGAVYAMGGSRRALVVDTNGPNEPALALLSVMGANITPTGIGRQLLDIGNVCSLLFSSDSRQQDDQNKLLIRSIYMPIPSGQPVTELQTAPAAAQSPSPNSVPAPLKPQPTGAWQGPSGSVGDAMAPPAPSFSQGAESPKSFTGASQTWGVPSKFEEAKTIAPPPQLSADLAQSSTAGTFQAPAKSPFQEIPQAPPMDFGGQFAQPASSTPQNPAPQAAPDLAAPTEFEQHFNPQPYFEEQPQVAQVTEEELRQAFERPIQPLQPVQQAAPLLDAPWLPTEASTSAAQAAPEPQGFAVSAADSPVVIPPRFPSSMYGSSTAAAIPPQMAMETSSPFAEQFQTPEPASYVAQEQSPAQEPAFAANQQMEVAETASGDNMALPSLEELGIQPPSAPENSPAPPAASDPSSQWWSAEEMQKPLQESQNQSVEPTQIDNMESPEAFVEEPQATPVQLAWGVESQAPAAKSASHESHLKENFSTPSFVKTSADETAQSAEPAESFMHAQPVEPGNIAAVTELTPELAWGSEPVQAPVDEVKNDPASLWMVEENHEQAAPEIAAAPAASAPEPELDPTPSVTATSVSSEPEPLVVEPAASTFFEQAAHAMKSELPPSPFANMQRQGTTTSSSEISPLPALASSGFPSNSEIPTSEDTLILSTVKDSQIQSNKISAASKAKPQVVQDPKLVAKETALLMSKLEHQVAEAGKRLNARSEAIKQRLNKQVEELLDAANDAEKNSQVETSDASTRLKNHSHNLSEEIRQQLSETASGGRYTIKQLLSTNQGELESKKVALESELKAVCEKFKEDAEIFAKDAQKKLLELVDQKTTEVEVLTDGVLDHVEDTNADFVATFDNRFKRFKDRIADEATSVKQSLERNVRSMFEEVEGVWERACEKLKDNQRDFEQRISHSVKSAKLISSENSKQMIATSIYPLVKERRLHLQRLIDELTKRFQHDSSKQAEAQLNGLEASLTEARHQLQNLVSDCLESINAVGKQQQAGLEDVFKDTSVQAETATTEVKTQLTEAHKQITETEAVCRSLVESSNMDTEVELTDARNATAQSIKTAKQDANSKLQEAIEEHSNSLDRLSNKVQTDINAERIKQTKAAREASEAGLSRLREAIQEAVAAVQAAREKHME